MTSPSHLGALTADPVPRSNGLGALIASLDRSEWRDLVWIATPLVVAGVLSGVIGLYPVFLTCALIVLSWVAASRTTAGCVLVALTSPLVALGSLDVGFHLLPCYVLAAAAISGVIWRGEIWKLKLGLPDWLLLGFVAVSVAIGVANLGTAPPTTVVDATGVNGRDVRSMAQLTALAVMVAIYFLMRVGLRDRRCLDAVVRALLVATAFVGAYAIYQVVGRELGLPYTFVNERRGESSLPVQDVYIRVNSTLTEASPLAQFTAISLFVGLAALSLPGGRPPWLRGNAWWLLPVDAGILVLATLSKSSWIACGLWLPILYARFAQGRAGRLRRLILVGGSVLAVALVGALLLRGGPEQSIANERYVRTGYWMAAIEIIRDRPLGVGFGNYSFYYPLYAPMSFKHEFSPGITDAHNVFLDAAVETGVIGALLLVAFCVVVILQGLRAANRARGTPVGALVTGLVLAFGVGVTMHLTYSYFYYPFEWVLAGLCAGAANEIHRARAANAPGR